jgi:hypothetical protein
MYVQKPRITVPALDATDIGAMKIAPLGELLLRPGAALP